MAPHTQGTHSLLLHLTSLCTPNSPGQTPIQTHGPSSLPHGAFPFLSGVCVCVYLRQMLLRVMLHPLFSVPLSMDGRELLKGPAQPFKQWIRVSVYSKAIPGFGKDTN